MTVTGLRLKISTPIGPLVPGRGFYQLEEEALYVQVAPFATDQRFFSFLEADTVRLDIDRTGKLLFIEVAVPRRQWTEVAELPRPIQAAPSDVRFLEFRTAIPSPQLMTDRYRTHLFIQFNEPSAAVWYDVASGVSLAVRDGNLLCGIWVEEIVDDLAGRLIAAHRKRVRRSLRPTVHHADRS